MNVNKVLTKVYENKTLSEHGKNEPKTNPIKATFKCKTPPFSGKKPKKHCRKPFWEKIVTFLGIYLHYCAYCVILLHISEDNVLCN